MRLRRDLAALLILLLVVLAFFWPLLIGGQWIPRGGGDLVSFIWPMYRYAARSLRAGVVPLWNPHLHSGVPFVADNQSGVFYPVNLLVFAVFGEPSYALMEALVVFHVWLAGAGLFALARGLGLRRSAALVGALAFALSDLFVTHIGNLNLNATAAWLPLLLLLTHRALTRRRIGWAAGAGAVLATAALAGHGQMLLFLALTLVLYFLYRLAADWRRGWLHALGSLGLAALIVAVGVGGAALTLLPAQEMAGHTGRGHLPYDEATRYSLPPRALIGFLAPDFYGRGPAGFWGPWDRVEVGYAGVATLVLAALGALTALKAQRTSPTPGTPHPSSDVSRLTFDVSRTTHHASRSTQHAVRVTPHPSLSPFPTPFFILLVILGLLLAMGRHTPVYRLLYRFAPTFDQVRAPARLILLVDLGLAMLAARGLDRLLSPAPDRGHPARTPMDRGHPARMPVDRGHLARMPLAAWTALAALLCAAVLLAVGLPRAQAVPPPDRVPQATASVVIAAVLLALSGLLVWLARSERWRRWLGGLFLALLALDLIGLGLHLEVEPNDPTLGFRHEDVAAFLRQATQRHPFRIEVATGAWQPDAALVHGLYDVGGVYNPLGLAPYQAYRWAVGERGSPLYNLLGVKYVLADKGAPPGPPGDERFVPVYTASASLDVYENTAALPRALVVHCAQVVPEHAAAWEAIHAPDFDPAQTVVLEETWVAGRDLPGADCGTAAEDGAVTFVRYGSNRVELSVRASAGGFLVLSDVYYPGWRATVDGVPVEVLRANYVFRAVPLPAGEHTVEMLFVPWTWRAGLAVTLVTWGALGIWVALRVLICPRKAAIQNFNAESPRRRDAEMGPG